MFCSGRGNRFRVAVAQGCTVEMASPFDKLTIFNESATKTTP